MRPEPASKRRMTLRGVADALGIPKSTVSLALSGKGNVSAATRERIAEAARALGYEPNPLAQRLAHGYSNNQVCLFGAVLDVGLATQKILSIQKSLAAKGLEAPIYTASQSISGASAAAQIRQLWLQRPRAIVCATPRVEPEVFEELEAYVREGGIVVAYDTPVPVHCDQVLFDREASAYAAAKYLLERGHRRLGLAMSSVPHPLPAPGADPITARLRGVTRALSEHGLSMRDEWFFRTANYERGGAEMAARFLSMTDRPSGLCIVNDYVALAFTAEILRAGVRVPEDVSIISHDNQPIAAYSPVPLTSMSHPAEAIAETVADLLLGRLEGRLKPEDPPRVVTLAGELVERASVLAVPV